MQVEIKSRWTGAVLYAVEIPDDTPSGLKMRAALEKATQAEANLAWANLTEANLAGASWRNGIVINKQPIQLYGLRWSVDGVAS